MRSEKQRNASRTNGGKSRGPTTPEGKAKVKFNGLKHGLRSNQVVLPGESAAEFNAELKGWADDWKPSGHTAAVLVERAAVASWRLRRCVRAEAELILELAAEKARDERQGDDDDDIGGRIELAEEMLHHEPAEAVQELKSFPEGVDRLISEGGELDEALDDGAEAWGGFQHRCVMRMLGHGSEDDPAGAGPTAADSARLAAANDRRIRKEGRDGLLAEPEASKMVARVRLGIARELRELRALRESLAAPAPRAEAIPGARFAGVSPELMLMHRYEMGIERQLRATIKDLVALDKARPDLRASKVDAPEVIAPYAVEAMPPAAPSDPEPATAAAPSEPEGPAAPAPSGEARSGREGRTWAVRRPGGGGSAS